MSENARQEVVTQKLPSARGSMKMASSSATKPLPTAAACGLRPHKGGDKMVTKGTYAKMARGEMVRFMAENNIENPVDIRKFDRLGYSFRSDLSSDTEYVFERKIEQ